MPPRKKPEPKPELLEVVPVDEMLLQNFRKHCLERHRQTMRFLTKGEHEADHNLHQSVLNHLHTNHIPEEEDEANAEG